MYVYIYIYIYIYNMNIYNNNNNKHSVMLLTIKNADDILKAFVASTQIIFYHNLRN